MNLNRVLKREGIEIIKPLDCFTINLIAKNITDKLSSVFSNHISNTNELFISLSRINMYIAKMPNDSSCAKYFYKNNSIYFGEQLTLAEMCNLATHECIHFLQESYDIYGNLNKLGLYSLNSSGLAINEAAVQLMASIANGYKNESVKYYNISINTISPNYYPLECTLLNQMIYFTGTYALFDSTLHSNESFKNVFISKSDKSTYRIVLSNLDKLLEKEDELNAFILESQYSNSEKERCYLNKKILALKNQISDLFFNTQNIILEKCFNKEFKNIQTKDDLRIYQTKLYNYKNIIGYTENYNFYNEFYRFAMTQIEKKQEELEQAANIFTQPSDTAIAVVHSSTLSKVCSKIFTLFRLNTGKQASQKF